MNSSRPEEAGTLFPYPKIAPDKEIKSVRIIMAFFMFFDI